MIWDCTNSANRTALRRPQSDANHSDKRTFQLNSKMSYLSSSSRRRYSKAWSHHIILALILFLNQIQLNFGSPVFSHSLAQFQNGRNIRHLPCVVRRSGVEGVCMFAIDCIKANGTHLGTCIDRFYFGSCCQLKDEAVLIAPEIIENSIDQNTISHYPLSPSTIAYSPSTNRPMHKVTTVTAPPKTTIATRRPITTNKVNYTPFSSSTPSGSSSTKLDTTTVRYVPITTFLSTESKTESSAEQHNIDKLTSPSLASLSTQNSVFTKLPSTTTEDSIKLQTFQSVQDATTFPAPTTQGPTRTTTPKRTTTSFQPSPRPSEVAQTSTTDRPTNAPSTTTTIHVSRPILVSSPSPSTTTTTTTTVNKKPLSTSTKRPIQRPTTSRRTTTTERPHRRTTIITTPNRVTVDATPKVNITTTTTEPFVTVSYVETTKSPRPRPRPTAQIATVPPTDLSYLAESKTTPDQSIPPSSTTSASRKPASTTPASSTLPASSRTTPSSTTTAKRPTTPKPTITTRPPGLVTWTNIAENALDESEESTETPAEWILIPSVLPATTLPSVAVPSSSVSGTVTKRPLSSTASPVKDQTTPFAQTTTSRPKPATRPPPPEQEPTTRFPTRRPVTKPSSALPPVETKPTKVTTLAPPSTVPNKIASTAATSPKTTSTTTTRTTTTTTEAAPTESDEDSFDTTVENFSDFNDLFEQTTFIEISETKGPPLGTTVSKLNVTHGDTSSSGSSEYTTSMHPSTAASKPKPKPTTSIPSSTVSLGTHTSTPGSRVNVTYTTVELLTPSTTTTRKPTTAKPAKPSTTSAAPVRPSTTATTTTTASKGPPVTATSSVSAEPARTTTSPAPATTTTPTTTTTRTTPTTTESTTAFSTTARLPDTTIPIALDNVTSEFGDQFTTEAISSTTSISQMLEGINYHQVCGKRMYPEPRIVGGSKASFGRWPWQISLRQWRTSTYLHKCGAALLNENWAITAAHCVDNVPPSDLLLRLGEYDLAEEEEPYLYQERRVQIVASHPQFDPRTFEYDLALLRFYEPVVFQPNIIPVCVPETDENFIGRTAFVTGWGRLYEDGPLPSVLQEVSVPVINNTLCEAMYRTAGYVEHIPHIFICAGWRKGGYDSCEGDSGGPMVIQRDDKRFLLAGVISWGIGCAEPNQPGVYTRISEFREWINQILQF